jgi:hypothetical protein
MNVIMIDAGRLTMLATLPLTKIAIEHRQVIHGLFKHYVTQLMGA